MQLHISASTAYHIYDHIFLQFYMLMCKLFYRDLISIASLSYDRRVVLLYKVCCSYISPYIVSYIYAHNSKFLHNILNKSLLYLAHCILFFKNAHKATFYLLVCHKYIIKSNTFNINDHTTTTFYTTLYISKCQDHPHISFILSDHT